MIDVYVALDRLKIKHPTLRGAKSYITSAVSASDTTSTVENTTSFSDGDYVLFGSYGEETAEIVTLTGVTDVTTLAHSTGPEFAHSVDSPVTEIDYDQVEIYTATGATETYSLAATVDLAVNEIYTEYPVSASTWYKVRYKNSGGSTYSDYSSVVAGSGWAVGTLGQIIGAAAEELEDSGLNEWSFAELRRYAKEGVIRLARHISSKKLPHLVAYDTQSFTASTATYSLPDRWMKFSKIDISFDGTDYNRAHLENEREGLPDDTYSTIDPRVYLRGTYFGVRPTPTSSNGEARMWFDQYPSEMGNESDTHGLPYGAHIPIIAYVKFRALRKKDPENANYYLGDYKMARDEYIDGLADGVSDYNVQTLKSRSSDLDGLTIDVPTNW